MADDKLREVVTPLGKMRARIISFEEVKFETMVGGAYNFNEPFTVDPWRYHVNVTLIVQDDGRIMAKNGKPYSAEVDPLGLGALDCIDERRADKRPYKHQSGTVAVRRKIAKQILPALVTFVQNNKAERARIGAIMLDERAKSQYEGALKYDELAIKSRNEADESSAKAKLLRERHAWVGDVVEEARPEVVEHQ